VKVREQRQLSLATTVARVSWHALPAALDTRYVPDFPLGFIEILEHNTKHNDVQLQKDKISGILQAI